MICFCIIRFLLKRAFNRNTRKTSWKPHEKKKIISASLVLMLGTNMYVVPTKTPKQVVETAENEIKCFSFLLGSPINNFLFQNAARNVLRIHWMLLTLKAIKKVYQVNFSISKNMCFLKAYLVLPIHWDKTQMLKNFLSDKTNVKKMHYFFTSSYSSQFYF